MRNLRKSQSHPVGGCVLSPQGHMSASLQRVRSFFTWNSSGWTNKNRTKRSKRWFHSLSSHTHTQTRTSTTLFCIMSFRHTLPPASRPWGLNADYIYGGGDLFKHMLPLTKSSMSNHPRPQPLLPPLGSDYNATFSLASITLEGRRGGWRENKDFCC